MMQHNSTKPDEPYLTIEAIDRFWSKVDRRSLNECWEWQANLNPNGYGQVNVTGLGGTTYAHRVSYMLCNGIIPSGYHILHACDNRRCCNPHHLSAGTLQENLADMVNKGRGRVWTKGKRGASHNKAKLTDDDVRSIRAAPEKRGVNVALSRQYGVTPTQIGRIRKRVFWTHIE